MIYSILFFLVNGLQPTEKSDMKQNDRKMWFGIWRNKQFDKSDSKM
jgi:hypothetical protein